ncbi:Transposase DDE domain-containing protein, partial [Flavobacterium micromati]
SESSGYKFKKYRTPDCKECPMKDLCTSRTGGREIDRSQYADAVEENNKRYQENPQLYRTRQEINEHIFGTIKRQWGYNHTNLTGLEKVNGEHSLIMLVYNIKRTMNILGIPDLIDKIQKWNAKYPPKGYAVIKVTFFKLLCEFKNIKQLFLSPKTASLTSEFCANRKGVIELI